MAPRSTTRATNPSRPRCTAWCSNTQRLSSPRPKTLPGRSAAVCQRRVRRLPRMRHSGARLLAPALRRLRPRQAACLQLQASRVLPLMRRAAHGPDRGASGGPRHPPCAVAPVGAVAADPAAPAAGRTAPAGDAGAAGGAPCDHAPSARPGWAQGRGSRQRRRHADPAFWVGGQHTSALPGAGRRVPAQRRRCSSSKPPRQPTKRCKRCCTGSSPD